MIDSISDQSSNPVRRERLIVLGSFLATGAMSISREIQLSKLPVLYRTLLSLSARSRILQSVFASAAASNSVPLDPNLELGHDSKCEPDLHIQTLVVEGSENQFQSLPESRRSSIFSSVPVSKGKRGQVFTVFHDCSASNLFTFTTLSFSFPKVKKLRRLFVQFLLAFCAQSSEVR